MKAIPLLCLCLATAARAELRLAPLFTDHAVLQRGKPVAVWGSADPGQAVKVAYRGHAAEAVADKQGRWRATLPEMEADATPADLVVSAEKTIALHDVVVGEVWLCSGQSNMEFPLAKAGGAKAEIAGANFPMIRQFKVPRTLASRPADTVAGEWRPASPETAGEFSGVAWFFARDLWEELKVPIGIINASWGGSGIESWLSAEALAANPAFSGIEERWKMQASKFPEMQKSYDAKLAEWEQERKAALTRGAEFKERKPTDPFHGARGKDEPSAMFNGMVNPVIPYALRGFLWYQGERNFQRPDEYAALLPALIADWRVRFAQGDLPFYFVQLPNYRIPADPSGLGYAPIRAAQAQALKLPATGMAVTIDVGEADNLHPRNKRDVGLRLARIAKAKLYGWSGAWSGPVLKSVKPEKNALRLSFDPADGGLVARKKPLPGFEIAGADGEYHAAHAELEGSNVLVWSDAVAKPSAVRYAWKDAPEAVLFDAEGLPAAPFQSKIP